MGDNQKENYPTLLLILDLLGAFLLYEQHRQSEVFPNQPEAGSENKDLHARK